MKLADIFKDGMVLQREKQLRVFGTADGGQVIRASIGGVSGEAAVREDGAFTVELPPLAAAEGLTLTVTDGTEEIVVSDVAVGEVWILGGQSNMEFHMRYEKHIEEERANLTVLPIRFFDVPELAFDGQDACFDYSRMGIWRKVTKEDLDYFSAVGYYFAKEIAADLSVPVGLVGCNWGGTASCAWMKPESVAEAGPAWQQAYEDAVKDLDMDAYWEKARHNPMNDRGNFFADPFSEFIMPRTPSMEEIGAFFGGMTIDFEAMMGEIQPQAIPGSLYTHMLLTIAPYSARGILWYQGESDDMPGRQELYGDMLSAVVRDWREALQADLPFLAVSLPGYRRWLVVPAMDYPAIRRGQEKAAEKTDKVWLASIGDAGEEFDIHPKNKKVVGYRLALLARGHVYGEEILCDAPKAVSAARDGGKIAVTLEHAEGLRIAEELPAANCLKLSGPEGEIAFTASAEGDRLVFDADHLPEEAVTVSMSDDNWFLTNVVNAAGIPALPFRFTL